MNDDLDGMLDMLGSASNAERALTFATSRYSAETHKESVMSMLKLLLEGVTYSQWLDKYALKFQQSLGVELTHVHKYLLSYCMNPLAEDMPESITKYLGKNMSILFSNGQPIIVHSAKRFSICTALQASERTDIDLEVYAALVCIEMCLKPFLGMPSKPVTFDKSYVEFTASQVGMATVLYLHALLYMAVEMGITPEVQEAVDFELSMNSNASWRWT